MAHESDIRCPLIGRVWTLVSKTEQPRYPRSDPDSAETETWTRVSKTILALFSAIPAQVSACLVAVVAGIAGIAGSIGSLTLRGRMKEVTPERGRTRIINLISARTHGTGADFTPRYPRRCKTRRGGRGGTRKSSYYNQCIQVKT